MVTTSANSKSDSITNNQITGVDEGDIIKLRGQTVVILRRGRLFSVSLSTGQLRTLDYINAFPPGIDASGDWYDEMLVAGDRIIVIGYSYARNGTQVNRFRLDSAGRFHFEDSHQLRSADYYSSRNYASRLIGNQLYFYTPLPLLMEGDPLKSLPALRRWTPAGSAGGGWTRLASAARVYAPRPLRNSPEGRVDTLHSVTRCNVTVPVLRCEATVVLGGDSRTFFVSGNAVYIWTDSEGSGTRHRALLYRLPLDGSQPAAVGVRGAPVDQFSFNPNRDGQALQVLVRSEGGGDAMWRPEVTDGDVALLSVPMATFGDGGGEVPLGRYQPLPRPAGDAWRFQNRFVGDHLLYGAAGENDDGTGSLIAVSLSDRSATALAIPNAIDRIDILGRDGIVVGQAADRALGFTTVVLGAGRPRVGSRFRLPEAQEGESRSHAFFYRSDTPDGSSGLLGLPVARSLRAPTAKFLGASASVLFLARQNGSLSEAGELLASSAASSGNSDACQASCVDWYGNARPIFVGDRIFALLGYELVEGRFGGQRVREVSRGNFAPSVGAGRGELHP